MVEPSANSYLELRASEVCQPRVFSHADRVYLSLTSFFCFFVVFKLHLTFQGRTDLFVLGHFKVK